MRGQMNEREIEDRESLFSRVKRPLWTPLSVLIVWIFIFDAWMPVSWSPTVDRTLYVKLPLEGVRFHWRFSDADSFLAGELKLRIANQDRAEEIMIFSNGAIAEGWRMIGDENSDGSFYFGFQSDTRHATSASDSLVLSLTVPEPLTGRGPHREGVLPAGQWTATGTYSALYGGTWNPAHALVLRGDEPIGFLQCWDAEWPLDITANSGWNGPRPEDDDEPSLLTRLNPETGVDGRRCVSHT